MEEKSSVNNEDINDLLVSDPQIERSSEVRKNAIYRRKFVKKAVGAVGTTALGIASGRGVIGFMNDIQENPGNPLSSTKDNVLDTFDQMNIINVDIHHEQQDPFLKSIEGRLGVQLLTIKEAYKSLGLDIDLESSAEFDTLLPLRWDHERAVLLEELYQHLPEFFREKNKKGEPLMLSLMNYGEDCVCAGTHHPTDNLIMLDIDEFNQQDTSRALELLTHENVHRLQDLGYSYLAQEVKNIFEVDDLKAFFGEIVTLLDQNEGRWDAFFTSKVRYGVQDLLGDKSPRENTKELESSLAEIYLHGRDVFTSGLSLIFGEKQAQALYQYLQDNVFRGHYYEEFPLNGDYERIVDEDDVSDVEEGVDLFNRLTQTYISQEALDRLKLSPLDAESDEVMEMYKAFQLSVENSFESDGYHKSLFLQKEQFMPIAVEQVVTEDNKLSYEYLELFVNQNGELLSYFERDPFNSFITLQEIAHDTLRIPSTGVDWTDDEIELFGKYSKAEWQDSSHEFEVVLWLSGKMSLKIIPRE